jgi:hypothetical protein
MALAMCFPGEALRDATKSAVRRRRAAQQPHETGVVSRAQFSSCCRYGAAGEQKHLPDWITTPRQQHRSSAGKRYARFAALSGKDAAMRDLNYSLKQLCRRNRDGSFATQADRERILDLIADQLDEMGFHHMDAHSLKPKHVEKLVERWLAEELSPGTIKNRMTQLRWWGEKVGKQNVVARTNAAYGIPDRVYVTNESKAKALDVDQLAQIRDPYVRMSLRLQAELGLRREESIKIVPRWADRGDRLVLKDSWCKGGREREIPILRLEQRQVIDEAKALANGKSLVAPDYKTYAAYLKHFRYECELVGIHGVHGHRHFYAQARYQELAGWACPARGGPTRKQLTTKKKALDREVREQISREIGHGRRQIVSVYLGR